MNLEGTRLGKYEIRSEIGGGAMGVVYHAHDPVLNRSVAVKVLFPHLVRDTQFVERFLREARAAASLDHPNIVTVHDAGEDRGWYYFVMSHLDGSPLSVLLRDEGPLPIEETLAILGQLADALDYAHEKGMVHRDVKPANVMVDSRGRAVLTDFGLVRAAQESRLTATGTVMGTPHYMSPEQASGKKTVGPASDRYSLAVMAFEMLCGEVPFDADSTPAILHMQVYDPPPPICPKCPSLPPDVEKVLSKALAKDPSERHGSGAAFVAALARVSEGTIPPEVPPPTAQAGKMVQERPRRTVSQRVKPVNWAWILVAVAVVAFSVIGLLTKIAGGDEGNGQRQAPTPAATFTSLAFPVPGETNATPTLEATKPMASTSTSFPPTSTPMPASAQGDTQVRPIDGMVMVYVPAGEFQMGSTEGGSDEQPVHTVALDGFWIDRIEVTNAQYRECVEAGECEQPSACDWGSPTYGNRAKADHPAVCVDWFGAQAYCAWAGVRLPTEAQWEYTAVGPQGSVYPWGDAFDCSHGNFDDETRVDDDVVPGGEGCDGYEKTAPVGSFETGASWVGALDMAGNVWEWVNDWYGDYPSSSQKNPIGPATGDRRVLRGGSWYGSADYLRSASRIGYNRGLAHGNLGFRCVGASASSP